MSKFPSTSNTCQVFCSGIRRGNVYLLYRNNHNLPDFNKLVELKNNETRDFVLSMDYLDQKDKSYVYSYGVSFSHNVLENQVNENSWLANADARTKSQSNMRIYLDVQHLTDFNVSGNGGGAGVFRTEKIDGVQSGEVVSICVGRSAEQAAGETTTVRIHSLEISCAGGSMGVPAVRGCPSHCTGQQVAMLGQCGNGGNGQKDYKVKESLLGQNGCVRIRW
jgi:hypothetical protein